MADHDKMNPNVPVDASDEALLESFFSAAGKAGAAGATPEPSADLLARVLSDAYEAQDGFMAEAAPIPAPQATTPAKPRRSLLAALLAAVGGAPGLAGLTAAAVAGFWVGMSPPASVTDFASTLTGANATTFTSAASGDTVGAPLLDYDMAYVDLLSDG